MKFKTNINCGGCIKAVTPSISKVEGITHWEVDTENPAKILTVEGPVSSNDIISAVKSAGFDIEALN
jgi:copper chaperone CopZ